LALLIDESMEELSWQSGLFRLLLLYFGLSVIELTDFLLTFLCFMRRFWNQVLTCKHDCN